MRHSRKLLLTSGVMLASLAVVVSWRVSTKEESSESPDATLFHQPAKDFDRFDAYEVRPETQGDFTHPDRPLETRLASQSISHRNSSGEQHSVSSASKSKNNARPKSEFSAAADDALAVSEPLEGFQLTERSLAPVSQSWSVVNPKLPGNSLSSGKTVAEIKGYQPSPGAVGVGLSLDITDANETAPSDPAVKPEVLADRSIERPAQDEHVGLTYEEELFRTKWGWAAYDQVRRVLREESSQ